MPFSDILDANFIQTVQDSAMEGIKEERSRFENIYKAIEKYCMKNKLMLSNKYVLTGDAENRDNISDRMYLIYTSNPFRHANELTNKIYQAMIKQPQAKYTSLKTVKEKEEFAIHYDFRQVAQIYKVQKHKHGEPYDIIKPVQISYRRDAANVNTDDKADSKVDNDVNNAANKVDSKLDNGGLLYLPSEIELIDIYHTLYNPGSFKDMDTAIIFESKLFDQVSNRKEQGILGAADCKSKKKDLIEGIKISLMRDWLPHSNNILIGAWAHDWYKLGKEVCVNKEKIQIISATTPDDLLSELQTYINSMSNFKISYRKQELHIPKDFRTARFTFYIHLISERGIIEKPFLDVFNCTDFEIVPCIKVNNILIGTKWVLLRFMFIDLWILRVIKNLGLITVDILNKKIEYLWKLIMFFKEDNIQQSKDKSIPCKKILFQGIHRDFHMDKKVSNIQGKRFYPYYPYVYLKQNNSYREI